MKYAAADADRSGEGTRKALVPALADRFTIEATEITGKTLCVGSVRPRVDVKPSPKSGHATA